MLLHEKYGKIFCNFDQKDQAILLTAGSLVWCTVQKTKDVYKIIHLEIESQIATKNLVFMHEIMKLCLHVLPANIAVPEIFDFLLYVRQNLYQLSDKSQKVALLRLFLMLDLLSDDGAIYQIAILDPTGQIPQEVDVLEKYIMDCWNNFFQSKFI